MHIVIKGDCDLKVKALTGNAKLAEFIEDPHGAELLAVGYADGEVIKYVKELRGETNILKDLSEISVKCDLPLIYAADTDNYGVLKRSAAVLENGKLLGISDMTVAYSDSPLAIGANGKLYDLKCGKVAVAIGDDLLSYELMRAFAVCGAEAVIAFQKNKLSEVSGILLRAYAYLTGLPFLLIAKNGVICASPQGKLSLPDENGLYDLTPLTGYALKIVKVRSER